MSKPSRRQRARALKPAAEGLEDRRLLSGVVSGVDPQGDIWQLSLIGPGALRVTKQPDASGNPAPLNSLTPISTITVAGTNPLQSKLVGKIIKFGPNSTGQVFFQNFNEQGSGSEQRLGPDGILSVNMPNFWLANTSANPATNGGTTQGGINIPDGVNSLRFGGVDTTSLSTLNTSSNLVINLGIPQYHGTSIILNKVITTAEPAPSGSTQPLQQGVIFNVTGRLNLFEANQIEGNASIPSGPFQNGGGTLVASNPLVAGGATQVIGAIGAIKVGGNATNFSTQVDGNLNTYYVGGETNNVALLSVGGSRDVYFGRGMDNTNISAHVIENLQANRGAVNSRVVSSRQIGRVLMGGDVINTQILSGYKQGLATVFQNQAQGQTPTARISGGITALVAGNVISSYFAASVQPSSNGTFGGTDNMLLPTGQIKAKVEGTIDNSSVSTTSPNTAFLAKQVILKQGPIFPPNVPSPPFQTGRLKSIEGAPGLVGPAADRFFHFALRRGRTNTSGRGGVIIPIRHASVVTHKHK